MAEGIDDLGAQSTNDSSGYSDPLGAANNATGGGMAYGTGFQNINGVMFRPYDGTVEDAWNSATPQWWASNGINSLDQLKQVSSGKFGVMVPLNEQGAPGSPFLSTPQSLLGQGSWGFFDKYGWMLPGIIATAGGSGLLDSALGTAGTATDLGTAGITGTTGSFTPGSVVGGTSDIASGLTDYGLGSGTSGLGYQSAAAGGTGSTGVGTLAQTAANGTALSGGLAGAVDGGTAATAALGGISSTPSWLQQLYNNLGIPTNVGTPSGPSGSGGNAGTTGSTSTSALAKLLGIDNSTASLLGGVGTTLAGLYGANQQQNTLQGLIDQQTAQRAPALGAFNNALANPNTFYQTAPAMGAADAAARALSVKGNPAWNPTLSAQLAANNLGGYNQYLNTLSGPAFGGQSTQAQLGSNLAQSQGNTASSIAGGLGNLTTPTNDLASLLKGLNTTFNNGTGLS